MNHLAQKVLYGRGLNIAGSFISNQPNFLPLASHFLPSLKLKLWKEHLWKKLAVVIFNHTTYLVPNLWPRGWPVCQSRLFYGLFDKHSYHKFAQTLTKSHPNLSKIFVFGKIAQLQGRRLDANSFQQWGLALRWCRFWSQSSLWESKRRDLCNGRELLRTAGHKYDSSEQGNILNYEHVFTKIPQPENE